MTVDEVLAMFAFVKEDNLFVTIVLEPDEFELVNHNLCLPPKAVPGELESKGLPVVRIAMVGGSGYYTDFPVESANSNNGTLQLIGPKGTATFVVDGEQ